MKEKKWDGEVFEATKIADKTNCEQRETLCRHRKSLMRQWHGSLPPGSVEVRGNDPPVNTGVLIQARNNIRKCSHILSDVGSRRSTCYQVAQRKSVPVLETLISFSKWQKDLRMRGNALLRVVLRAPAKAGASRGPA